MQEFIFNFNVKKWNREYVKKEKSPQNERFIINLFDVHGKPILFNIKEKSFSENKIDGIRMFKGKSSDELKVISLTILSKSMSGAYLENGIQYFIEPVKGTCHQYKVYVNPTEKKKLEVSQSNDFLK